ncbi:hypothetical protein CU097_000838, partial [Rhizopus azygosporus]
MYNNHTSVGEPSSSKYVPTEDTSLIRKDKASSYDHEQPEEQETYGTIEEPTIYDEDTSQNKELCTYIIIFITTLITILIFFILWFIPSFAERTVKESVQFKFQTASIINVTQENTMSMHVSGQIQLDPSLYAWSNRLTTLLGTVDISPSQLEVIHSDQTMGTIDLPALSLNASSAVTEFDFITQFIIQDSHAFMTFCKQAVQARIVTWHIQGPLSVSIGWVPWHPSVDLNKDIHLEGMNGLTKTEMQSLSFPGAHPLGGVAISGTVGLYNPSNVLSLRLGDIDFGIYIPGPEKDTQIAIVRAVNANLIGNQMNYFNVTGRTLPITSDAESIMSSFLTQYLHGESSLVHVRGSSFGPDPNQPTHTPGWLREALEAITIQVPFPGASETDLIQKLELSNIKIDFSSLGDPLISADAVAYLKQPKEIEFDLDVQKILPTVYLYLNQESLHPFAVVKPNEPCPAQTQKIDDHKLMVTSKIEKAPFKVLPGGQKDFEEFLNRVFHEKNGRVYMQGSSDAQVESAFGHLTVQNLQFQGSLDIQGMQGLKDPEVTSVSLVRGYQDALEINTTLKIHNPSNAAVNLGDINMVLLFEGHPVGNATVRLLSLKAGEASDLKVSAWLEANNTYANDFIGRYISTGIGKQSNVNLTISGDHPNATRSKFIRSLIRGLVFHIPVPPFDKDPLLIDCQMNILSSTIVMSLSNPFPGITMTINNIHALASYEIYDIGSIAADFEDKSQGWKEGPMVLPGPLCHPACQGIVVESEKIPVMTKKLGFEAIKKALGGSIVVSVESRVGVMLDDYRLDDL